MINSKAHKCPIQLIYISKVLKADGSVFQPEQYLKVFHYSSPFNELVISSSANAEYENLKIYMVAYNGYVGGGDEVSYTVDLSLYPQAFFVEPVQIFNVTD